MELTYVSGSELLFYGGLAAMGLSAVLAAAGAGVFMYTGRRLRARLKEEYGIYAVRGPRGVPNSLSHELNR